ncbi:amino acid adenylation domain-containing protein [Streptomyces sp. MUM 203J]|uniref:amino acid adenylation domain-containing protein n=1 Tax=Streptomyces sp. MUM 203J TaxID=2791990 RepID=UPI001F0460AB|nr:amino acid adenylation domain-containing protein [Streptomyces sp. MUM 203J]MCH0538340.1 amino acid adenylation domain-containing protein [Streptomyces sp. MUM 203J]
MDRSLSYGPSTPVPDDATAHHTLLAVAARTPDAPALGVGGRTVSYRELVARARAVQVLLQRQGVRPGTFVPVLARPGAAFTVAALGVLLAGAAYAAVDPRWPAERLGGVLGDLRAELVLDAAGVGAASYAVPGGARAGAGPSAVPVVRPTDGAVEPDALGAATPPGPATPSGPAGADEVPVPVEVGADSPACVFFTSGSTGRPKGVAIPHRAMIRTFLDCGYAEFGPDTVMPMVAAPYWDAGTLEVFGPLLNGGCAVEVPDGLLTPAALRRLIREDGVNTMFLTSSLVNLFLDEEPEAFTGIRLLMTGGERVSPAHAAKFLAAHPDARLVNGYGPVESMVFVSSHEVSAVDLDAADGIPVGTAIRNTVLAVADREGTLVPAGETGELLVGGDGLALGYVNRPEEDAKRFGTLELPGRGRVRTYRTGDLVRMTSEGRVSYIGRADRQFKVRGFRIEPGEVERVLGRVEGVKECFLIPLRTEGGTVTGTVCAYTAEAGHALPACELRHVSEGLLPSHLRPDRFVRLDALPLGPTGKADLRAVERLVRPAAERNPSVGDDGSPVLRAVRAILGVPALSEDDDLLAHGANSLQVLRIAARLSALLDVEFSARDVYRHSSVRGLERLARTRPGRTAPAAPADSGQLSPGERRFWIAERLAPGAPGHVAMSRVEISGRVDPERLHRALSAVVAAHPALRTTFPLHRGRPRRAESADATLPLLVRRSAAGWSGCAELTDELAAVVHDLEGGPLLAAGLLSESDDRHTLLIAAHHAVYDAHSERVLLTDLAAAWAGEALAPAPAPPAAPPASAARDRAFWQAELAGVEPLALPAPAPSMRALWTSPVDERPFPLPADTGVRLRAAALHHRTPALTLLVAAWWRALSAWTGQLDVTIGTVVAGRDPAYERTIGYLANGVPVRVSGHPGAEGTELVGLVGERLLRAFDHAALPTDEIAALAPRPKDGRMPLYQTVLALQRVGAPVRLGEAVLRPRPAPPLGPQAELVCELWEDGDELTGALHTPAGLLPPGTGALLTELFTSELHTLLTKDQT